MSAVSAERNFIVPVSNGIFAHQKRIGAAIWVFIWLVDKTTKEIPSPDGKVDGLVFGGQPVPLSKIACDMEEMSLRSVRQHLDQLAADGYIRKIDHGIGRPNGYAVVNSKRYRHKNTHKQGSETTAESCLGTAAGSCLGTQAEKGRGTQAELCQDPGSFMSGPRQDFSKPRQNPATVDKEEVLQDNTKHKSNGDGSYDGLEIARKRKRGGHSSEDVEKVRLAYPLKKAPGADRKAIEKAMTRLAARGESDPAAFLIARIAAWKAARDRDGAAGRFVPDCPHAATWFNQERYDAEGLQPVKNCVLPDGKLGTAAELEKQTGWQVIRGAV